MKETTPSTGLKGITNHWKDDLTAAISVSLVVLPLALGDSSSFWHYRSDYWRRGDDYFQRVACRHQWPSGWTCYRGADWCRVTG